MAKKLSGPRIEVRRLSTRRLERVILLPDSNRRRAEKVMSGLLINLDIDRFYAVKKGLEEPESC